MSTNTTRNLVERLDRLLPQTQCGQCGYDGCRPYAEAMVAGDADIDRCTPGGDAGARALARLLEVAPKPYDRSRGQHNPPLVALVVEADCIGRTQCIKHCPVAANHPASSLIHASGDHLYTCRDLFEPYSPCDCLLMYTP